MKTNNVLVCLFGGLFGMMGCASMKTMPESDLVSVEYTLTTMRGNEYEGRVFPDSSGGYVLCSMKKGNGLLYEKQIGNTEMMQLRSIIKEEKMYKFKESYSPMLRVLDGRSWHFKAQFADGSHIYSSGENAFPGGNGLSRIRGYMEALIAESEKVVSTENEY